jgi:hypothetical protein
MPNNFAFKNRVTLSTPGAGSWTVPAGVRVVYVTLVGAGGGGGGASSVTDGSTGGGCGEVLYRIPYAIIDGATSVAHTIGTGGTGGTAGAAGNAGGRTSFGSALAAIGGQGGADNSGSISSETARDDIRNAGTVLDAPRTPALITPDHPRVFWNRSPANPTGAGAPTAGGAGAGGGAGRWAASAASGKNGISGWTRGGRGGWGASVAQSGAAGGNGLIVLEW